MSFWNLLKSRTKLDIVHDEADQYNTDKVGSISIPDELTHTNAFTLANTVTEIYFPIDFYADRISKLRYFIADKSGNEVQVTELNRFLTSINPLYSFTDLVYQYIFSYLSAGFSVPYRGIPSIYSDKINVNTINRLDILQPNLLEVNEFTNVSILDIQSLNDLIRQARYTENFHPKWLDIPKMQIDCIDSTRRKDSIIFSQSPLFKAIRSINNLLATYSARYNIYVNNGAAGYLVKKPVSGQSLEAAIDPKGRKDIIDDINNRNGITGRRNLWGISGVPIEFINTLSDIQKLMPFEETLEDSIKIASVFLIPPELVPRKDQSTFNNKSESERSVWENGLMSMVGVVCQNFARAFMLDKIGYSIKADFSSVSALSINEDKIQDTKKKQIDNSILLYEKGLITYNAMLVSINEQPIIGGDKYIFDMTKTPYAVKLGVGGTQAMQAVLTDPTMTLPMKKNALIVVFGLTEQEATQLTTQ